MKKPTKILLQTTIPTTDRDWSIARFSSLAALLRDQRDDDGNPLYDVTARDRDPLGQPDSVLSTIDHSDFDQLWLSCKSSDVGISLPLLELRTDMENAFEDIVSCTH